MPWTQATHEKLSKKIQLRFSASLWPSFSFKDLLHDGSCGFGNPWLCGWSCRPPSSHPNIDSLATIQLFCDVHTEVFRRWCKLSGFLIWWVEISEEEKFAPLSGQAFIKSLNQKTPVSCRSIKMPNHALCFIWPPCAWSKTQNSIISFHSGPGKTSFAGINLSPDILL